MKIKKGGCKYLVIGLLIGMASAAICLVIGTPQIVTNVIATGVAAAIVFSLKSKWMA